MILLGPSDYRTMPWKNGGGETTEIAAFPDGAVLDAFDWRVSTARVAADGPFSAFPGIDRTLAVLEGGGIALAIAGRDAVTLTPASPPLFFPADVATSAMLTGGPILDLNVMTRRGRARHAVRVLDVDGSAELDVSGPTLLLFCPAGGVTVGVGADTRTLGPMGCLRAELREAARWTIAAALPTRVYVIEIAPAG